MNSLKSITLILSFTCLTLGISGCSNQSETTNISAKFILPDGLKDCQVYKMLGQDGGGIIKVVRCPNSQTTTTYSVGKSDESVTVLEAELKKAKLKESALNKLSEAEKQVLGLKPEQK